MKRIGENFEEGSERFGLKKSRVADGNGENSGVLEINEAVLEKDFTATEAEERAGVNNGTMPGTVLGNNRLLNVNEGLPGFNLDTAVDNIDLPNKWDFDINFDLIFGQEKEENMSVCNSDVHVHNANIVEVIDIASEDSSSDVEIIGYNVVDKGKGIAIEEGNSYDIFAGLDLGLEIGGISNTTGQSSLVGDVEGRYTREEKGKGKIVDSWLSLGASQPVDPDSWHAMEEVIEMTEAAENMLSLGSAVESPSWQPVIEAPARQPVEIPMAPERLEPPLRDQVDAIHREMLVRRARRLARANDPLEEVNRNESSSQAQKSPALETSEKLGDSCGPFSDALKTIRARNQKKGAGPLIKWRPLEENQGHGISMPFVPSLLDLSLRALAENAEGIVSLALVPDMLRKRLGDLLCDTRKMDVYSLKLLAEGCPTEIRVKNSSWLADDQFEKIFGNCETRSLRVLQLDLCGQCMLDFAFTKTLARSSNSLHNLAIVSLRGACRLTDNGLKALVTLAPVLQSINVGQCNLLTSAAINFLADALGSILKELYIDDCLQINVMSTIPAWKKFKQLEVLSVAGIETVCDQFMSEVISSFGQRIKELDISNCQKLTDCSLKMIGGACADLCSLSISNLHSLTDLTMEYLGNGCRSIQKLKLCHSGFSDETMAAFLESSGCSLMELSLNHVSKVGPNTALALATCSKKLMKLDISWCRKITDEALGLIVDCCPLKLLKIFGCTQITNIFLNGHFNPLVRIIGLPHKPMLGHLNLLEPEEVLLRYSPLLTCPEY